MTRGAGRDIAARRFGARSSVAAGAPAAMLAFGLCACSYDLSRLRGHRDGASDAPQDDIAQDVVATGDGSDAASVLDVGLQDGSNCTFRPSQNAVVAGTFIGRSLVMSSDTTGVPVVVDPPDGGGCVAVGTSSRGSEIVYQYTVQAGTRLTATTDAPVCTGVFDTVVHIRSDCDPSDVTLACSDDDNVLSACTGAPGTASTAVATVAPGQTVYIAVAGYDGHVGRFRLVLTENGLVNAPPPTDPTLNPADRCGCPDALEMNFVNVPFPFSGDIVSAPTAPLLSSTGDRLTGQRILTVSKVAGAALDFQLLLNQLGQGAGCANATAVVDLLIAGDTVQSFVVDAATLVGAPLRVAWQTFAPVTVANGAPITVGLRVRSVNPTGCGGIQFDLGYAGNLTLLGG